MLDSPPQVFLLLVLLELISVLNSNPARPQHPSTPSSSVKNISLEKGHKSKERILNTSHKGTISFGQYSEQDIIFPDAYEEVLFEAVPRIDGPPNCANGTTFCESFDSYPYHHLRDILQKKKVDKGFFFGEDEMELQERFGLDEEVFLCDSIRRLVFPRVGKTKDDKWRVIVNQGKDEEYVQGVIVETCRRKDSPCNILTDLPHGHRTFCRQKYVYRRLMAMNPDGTFSPDTFQLPSACCCSYQRPDFITK